MTKLHLFQNVNIRIELLTIWLDLVAIGLLNFLMKMEILLNEDTKSIQLNKEFTLEMGETAMLKEDDLRIKFLEVVEDSRCPSGFQCIRGGSVRIKVDARYDNEKILGEYELEIGDNSNINSYVEIIPQKYRDELSSPI